MAMARTVSASEKTKLILFRRHLRTPIWTYCADQPVPRGMQKSATDSQAGIIQADQERIGSRASKHKTHASNSTHAGFRGSNKCEFKAIDRSASWVSSPSRAMCTDCIGSCDSATIIEVSPVIKNWSVCCMQEDVQRK